MGIKNCVAIGNGGDGFNVPDYVEMEGNISAHNGGERLSHPVIKDVLDE